MHGLLARLCQSFSILKMNKDSPKENYPQQGVDEILHTVDKWTQDIGASYPQARYFVRSGCSTVRTGYGISMPSWR